ncbi:MAG: TrmB family transcriptional regulator, partial [Promethearchaeota archaeon]
MFNWNQNIKKEIKEALKNLGFTDYYIAIYLRLLKEGEMDARTLSSKTKVPYSRIYEILNEMIKKGIISKIEGRPSTFIPLSPVEMFENLKIIQELKFKQNIEISKDFLERLYKPTITSKDINGVLLYGLKACIVHLKQMIKNTSYRLDIIISNTKFLVQIQEELNLLRLRKAKIRVILGQGEVAPDLNIALMQENSNGFPKNNNKNRKDANNKSSLKAGEGNSMEADTHQDLIKTLGKFAEIKIAEIPLHNLIISDGVSVLQVENSKLDNPTIDNNDFIAFSISNQNYAKIFNSYFE